MQGSKMNEQEFKDAMVRARELGFLRGIIDGLLMQAHLSEEGFYKIDSAVIDQVKETLEYFDSKQRKQEGE